MLLMIQWLLSYLIVVCGKVFAALFPKPKDRSDDEDKVDKE